MRKKVKASAAEWTILETLWTTSPLSVREVYESIGEAKMNAQTVRTLMDRLLTKGMVKRKEVHGVWVFEPNCKRDVAVKEEGRGFLERFFGGSPALGAAYFLKEEKLSEKDLRHIRKILDEMLEGEDHD